MKVVTAVEKHFMELGEVSVFLAGGITNCWEWQDAVIAELKKKPDTNHLVVFNPRRKNFPIDDPNASQEQIEWEFEHLEGCDIFSMYFCAGDSDQPICMYELGRNLILQQAIAEDADITEFVVISCEEGYKRKSDVLIQSELALGEDIVDISSDKDKLIKMHADKIYDAYLAWMSKDKEQFRY